MIFPPLNGWKPIHSKPLQTLHSYFIVSTLFRDGGTKKDASVTFFCVQAQSANWCFLSLCKSRALTDVGYYGQAMKITPIFSDV